MSTETTTNNQGEKTAATATNEKVTVKKSQENTDVTNQEISEHPKPISGNASNTMLVNVVPANVSGESKEKAVIESKTLINNSAKGAKTSATASPQKKAEPNPAITKNTKASTTNTSKKKVVREAAITQVPKASTIATSKKKTASKNTIAQVPKASTSDTTQKKALGKLVATTDKKIKLAATCYHYYRNWLKDFMRSHGVPSAKFQKSPESYDGHITVLEAEKAKGIKALEQWHKENPDTKELFWDIKK